MDDLSERIHTAHLLQTLEERCRAEAAQWANADCRAELERLAVELANAARSILLDRIDLNRADATASAATYILGHVEGARRFFRNILSAPEVRRT